MPGEKTRFTKENAREMAARAVEARREIAANVATMLAEAGMDPDTAPETLVALARKAAKGDTAAMRLFLAQTGQLKGNQEWDGVGECPTCGLDPSGGLVIGADDMDSLDRAVGILRKLLAEGNTPWDAYKERLHAKRDGNELLDLEQAEAGGDS